MAVVAFEGGGQFCGHARAHFTDNLCSRLGHERRQQPAAQPPGQAKAAVQNRRPDIQRTIDINLLHLVRTIAAIRRHPLDCSRLHRCQYLAGNLAAADRIKTDKGLCVINRLHQILSEIL